MGQRKGKEARRAPCHPSPRAQSRTREEGTRLPRLPARPPAPASPSGNSSQSIFTGSRLPGRPTQFCQPHRVHTLSPTVHFPKCPGRALSRPLACQGSRSQKPGSSPVSLLVPRQTGREEGALHRD